MKTNLKKLAVLLAAAVLSTVLLVGCGSSESGKSVDEVFEAVSAANPIATSMELTDSNLALDFMLDADSVAEFKGVQSNDQSDAGLVLVIKAVDGQADHVKEMLESYQADQITYWGLYPEFADAQANVEAGVVSASGNIVVIAFPANGVDASTVSSAVTDALK